MSSKLELPKGREPVEINRTGCISYYNYRTISIIVVISSKQFQTLRTTSDGADSKPTNPYGAEIGNSKCLMIKIPFWSAIFNDEIGQADRFAPNILDRYMQSGHHKRTMKAHLSKSPAPLFLKSNHKLCFPSSIKQCGM